jgi:hypothetical protein
MYLARLASGGKFGKKLPGTSSTSSFSQSAVTPTTTLPVATESTITHYTSTNSGSNYQNPTDSYSTVNLKKSTSVLSNNQSTAVTSTNTTTTTVQKCTSPHNNNNNHLSIKSVEKLLEEAAYSGDLILCTKKLKEFPKNHNQYDLCDTVNFG